MYHDVAVHSWKILLFDIVRIFLPGIVQTKT